MISTVATRAVVEVWLAATPDRASGDVPTPVSTAPPGAAKLQMILNWTLYVVVALAVLGVLFCAGRMFLLHKRGDGGEHATALGWTLAGCVLAGSASGIVAAFL